MNLLETWGTFAGIVTAVAAAMAFAWRWHTTAAEDRSRFIDILDASVLILASVTAGISLYGDMRGDLESIILALALAAVVALGSVIISALVVFALRARRARFAPSKGDVAAGENPALERES